MTPDSFGSFQWWCRFFMVFICGRFIVPVGAIGGSCGMALSGAVVWPFLGSACCVCVCVCVCVGGWVGGWVGVGACVCVFILFYCRSFFRLQCLVHIWIYGSTILFYGHYTRCSNFLHLSFWIYQTAPPETKFWRCHEPKNDIYGAIWTDMWQKDSKDKEATLI